jgi:hypothetical protein
VAGSRERKESLARPRGVKHEKLITIIIITNILVIFTRNKYKISYVPLVGEQINK